ncbi:Hypothetical protein R9X50_00657000 [Acrodontium crateriforme]|uniref:Major facilitator superfamily (MFS) profile domain-containing protein n=1 Tax=Acrodontium crateriforme TaxID=150365 RepID=A0AAQ3M840_9PEZI|nr:Hypothetical protein R9X50_00657000 [Acrodontium crateriforme]
MEATDVHRLEGESREIELQSIRSSAAGPENVEHAVAAVQPVEVKGVIRLKLISCIFCFFNAGINDGSLGALIPYILRQYNISTGWMAIPYGVAFFGWLIAAFIGGYSRIKLGSGGVIVVGAAFQFIAQVFRFWVPPFGLFSITFFLVALGQALQEPQANTFVSNLKSAHRWLGLLHASYAIGALVGPLIAAAIASNFLNKWAAFYYIPTAIGLVNVGVAALIFRDDISIYQRWSRRSSSIQFPAERHSATALVEFKATLRQKPVWMLSIFFFLYLGAAITAGGWVVEFLNVVRGGKLSQVGYISSAFYGGLAAGRLLLAEPTFRFGEKRMFLLYGAISLVLQIVFWRVPNLIVDAAMVSFMGFLLGPAFATGVSVGSKLIPVELQPSGLAMIFVMAQAGGALFPAITGVITAGAGVGTLQPILVGLLAAMCVAWFFVPDPRKVEK